ncbi:MAG: HPr family phosphocarrier protein [Dorea sp.]|nr:HPr family phosphocarrier protein [Dorea sp.]
MQNVTILLNTIEKVKSFVNVISKLDCEFVLRQGHYDINAESIMGIFSLDLSNKIALSIDTDDEDKIADAMEKIKPYLA